MSHSSTESEVISLDVGLRMDGLSALDLWDVVLESVTFFEEYRVTNQHAAGNRLRTFNTRLKRSGNREVEQLSDVDHVTTNASSSQCEAQLFIFEDIEAVIKMISKGRSPTMRHVSRTRRVALDRLFDRIDLDPRTQMKYVDTKNKLANVLTKGNFTRHKVPNWQLTRLSSRQSVQMDSRVVDVP